MAGVASHAILDTLPHQDYDPGAALSLDGCAVVAALALAGLSGGLEGLAGAVGGVIPDLENLAQLGNTAGPKLFPSHWIEHKSNSFRTGIAVELLAAAGALLLAYMLGPRQHLRDG